MSKRRRRSTKPDGRITWDRLSEIFHHPRPPHTIWERQFDYGDEGLARLARTAYEDVDYSDLWYYFHDLAYVELQPDLFAYLFPVCLMDWHESLQRNDPCSHGDSEFHYGVHQGNVLEKMLTSDQRMEVFEVFRDSLLQRLDRERGGERLDDIRPLGAWVLRFNSLGIVMPRIDLVWTAWWRMETPGRAFAVLEYCSALMYFDFENPLFKGGLAAGQLLLSNDTWLWSQGWHPENIEFLRTTLTADYVAKGLEGACKRLEGEPEEALAKTMIADLDACRELLVARIQELPTLLSDPEAEYWSV